MNPHSSRAALYARVSSDGQVKDRTIASQLEALDRRVRDDGLELEADLRFIDEGYSGSTLVRSALERLRDLAAVGGFDRLYVHSPDRLARAYVYQVLLVDELRRCGVELIFLNHAIGQTPEDHLLLQMQGMVAEYERAKILERVRRGKLHSARAGRVSAIGKAPYGYRYVSKADGGGEARWEIHREEAAVVRQMFLWMAQEGCSLTEIGRRLKRQGARTQTGRDGWLSRTIWGILKNEAYRGATRFGKTVSGEPRARLRPQRGRSEHPRRVRSVRKTLAEDQVPIPVPALVSDELFEAVQERLLENKKGNRRARGSALPAARLAGLQALRLCLLRPVDDARAQEQVRGGLPVLLLHGLDVRPLRPGAAVLEQVGSHGAAGCRGVGGRVWSSGRTGPGQGRVSAPSGGAAVRGCVAGRVGR
jgi:site-specific DNA recombinase